MRHTLGTVAKLIKALCLDDGKSLNALNLPISIPNLTFSVASKSITWNAMKGLAWCRNPDPYPMSDLTWAITATAGCMHNWHIDANGFSTVIEPLTGCKIWIVACSKELHIYNAFSSMELFGPSFDVEKPNTHLWKVEAFVLWLGMQLWVTKY